MSTIGNYKLLKTLGEGGYGKAYLTERNGEKFVIKRILTENFNKTEVNILKKIARSNCTPDVLCYVEDFEKDKYTYIVTKAVLNSESLHNFIWKNRYRLNLENKLQIMLNITNAFSKIHDLKIAHVDVKGDNILINPRSLNIQLIDFGLACDKEFLKQCYIGGTIDYHSPELLQRIINKQGHFSKFSDYIKNDIFSLGILFYYIMYTVVPMDEYYDPVFKGNNYKKMFPILLDYYTDQPIGQNLDEDQDSNENIPINKLISKMLSIDKSKRPSIKVVIKTLDKLIKRLKPKICPEDKELNPKTNKCIKRCKPNQIRNPKTNKCTKIKTTKSKK